MLTAALSSLDSGLYATGRILRPMAKSGSAPGFTGLMNRSQVPYGGILLTGAVCVLGVGLNYLVLAKAFETVLNFSAIAIIATWGLILICHLRFVKRAQSGEYTRPSYQLRWSPVMQTVTPAFLGAVVVLMWFDEGAGRVTLMCLPILVAVLVGGWFASRRKPREKELASVSHGWWGSVEVAVVAGYGGSVTFTIVVLAVGHRVTLSSEVAPAVRRQTAVLSLVGLQAGRAAARLIRIRSDLLSGVTLIIAAVALPLVFGG